MCRHGLEKSCAFFACTWGFSFARSECCPSWQKNTSELSTSDHSFHQQNRYGGSALEVAQVGGRFFDTYELGMPHGPLPRLRAAEPKDHPLDRALRMGQAYHALNCEMHMCQIWLSTNTYSTNIAPVQVFSGPPNASVSGLGEYAICWSEARHVTF